MDWGLIFHLLGKVYQLTFEVLLDYPMTLIYMYYEWAVYDYESTLYMETMRAASI